MTKIRTIDVFAGCGGLTEGFAQTGLYETKACVEWEKAQCDNLRKRLKEKWNVKDAEKRVIRFDIQRTDELLNGFDDKEYGKNEGLDKLTDGAVDLVIGGPPCQAYSIAGRIRDKDGMKNDYRNYLFESYLRVVDHFKPKAFVFENVPGILSAKPGGIPIIELLHEQFSAAGYDILPDLKDALFDVTEYGIPQKRKRIIILGVSREYFGEGTEKILELFYKQYLPGLKSKGTVSLNEAIGDLPKLFPSEEQYSVNGKKMSHTIASTDIKNHVPRYHNKTDINTFSILAKDIETGKEEYVSIDARKRIYTEMTGKESNIHKYNVLRWDQPSNTIPAHLAKDGLRHIHPDSEQARTITVREAARLQTFPDDYEFVGAQTDQYKMIGNAVPPEFARKIALALYKAIFSKQDYGSDDNQ